MRAPLTLRAGLRRKEGSFFLKPNPAFTPQRANARLGDVLG